MLYPFILTTIAGLSTMLGTIPIFINIKNENKLISASCSFASGVMLSISILDLIPESLNYLYKEINIKSIFISFIFITIGIIMSFIIDKSVDKINNSSSLYKVGILSMIVIILHNIPEGIITYIVSNKNIILGVSICISIAIHNIPEGVSIAIPIYYSTKSKIKAILYTLLSSLSELMGAIITYLFLKKYMNNLIIGIILSITAGIMIQISINKLYPESKSYNEKRATLFFIIGFIFMIFSLLLNTLIS